MKDLLLHLLIIWFPILLQHAFLLDKSFTRLTKKHQWAIGIMAGISANLCTVFPVMVGGFRWDLRAVPLLVAILYGGYRSGIVTTVLMLGYRLTLGGGPLLYDAILIHVIYALPAFLLVKRFPQFTRAKRLVWSLGLGTFAFFDVFVNLVWYLSWQQNVQSLQEHQTWLYALILVLECVAVGFSVLIIEIMMENARMRIEMQRAEKLSVISELAASIAHEVRNPLTVVRGFIQLVKESMTEKNKEYMDTVISELDRAEFIISDYLNFAKPQLEHASVVNVDEMLQHVSNIIKSYAVMQGVELIVRSDGRLFIHVDKDKMKQVILNLIKNSIEAMPTGGSIEVRAYREKQHVLMQVVDDGEGMTEQQLSRLGQPFYSTKEKGTGLGLMVTFRLVEAMQGTLHFQSQKGKGTTATIRIPELVEPVNVTTIA